jgi:hypothetical protein
MSPTGSLGTGHTSGLRRGGRSSPGQNIPPHLPAPGCRVMTPRFWIPEGQTPCLYALLRSLYASRSRTFRAEDEAAGSEVRPAGAQCGTPDQALRRCAIAGGEPALLCWREGERAQPTEVLRHIPRNSDRLSASVDLPMGIERAALGAGRRRGSGLCTGWRIRGRRCRHRSADRGSSDRCGHARATVRAHDVDICTGGICRGRQDNDGCRFPPISSEIHNYGDNIGSDQTLDTGCKHRSAGEPNERIVGIRKAAIGWGGTGHARLRPRGRDRGGVLLGQQVAHTGR